MSLDVSNVQFWNGFPLQIEFWFNVQTSLLDLVIGFFFMRMGNSQTPINAINNL